MGVSIAGLPRSGRSAAQILQSTSERCAGKCVTTAGSCGRGLAILCVPNSEVDLESWLTFSPRWCSLDFGPHLAPTLMHKASMSRRATGLALMSRDFSAVRAVRRTEAGCQPGETLASAGRGVFVLSATAYLSTQGELHLGGQRRSLTGWRFGSGSSCVLSFPLVTGAPTSTSYHPVRVAEWQTR